MWELGSSLGGPGKLLEMFEQRHHAVSFMFEKDRCLTLGSQLPDPVSFYWIEEEVSRYLNELGI